MSQFSHKKNKRPLFNQLNLIHRFKKIDKASGVVLVLSVVVGALAGILGAVFSRAVTWIVNLRTESVAEVSVSLWLSLPLMFVISGLLAALGYFLVKKVAPEAGGVRYS